VGSRPAVAAASTGPPPAPARTDPFDSAITRMLNGRLG
jgi:hypothetical protein